jgi:hypothetical protein
MKTATIPSLRVEPALRTAAEEVLRDGESLSGFVEYAVRAQIQQRQEQAAFVARGLASRDRAKVTGVLVIAWASRSVDDLAHAVCLLPEGAAMRMAMLFSPPDPVGDRSRGRTGGLHRVVG